MKFLALLFLISCATQTTTNEVTPGTENATTENAPVQNVPTESNAQPVSPYTVKPCYCMKIFQPVCADGKPYGNSCEAECQGHKTWKDGQCPKK